MKSVAEIVDGLSLSLGFNVDSSLVIVLVIGAVLVFSLGLAILAIYVSKKSAAAELANYGARSRPLTSFVCKVCLHRSYAKSHIEQRYCSRCDKYYPEKAKIWKFPENDTPQLRVGLGA